MAPYFQRLTLVRCWLTPVALFRMAPYFQRLTLVRCRLTPGAFLLATGCIWIDNILIQSHSTRSLPFFVVWSSKHGYLDCTFDRPRLHDNCGIMTSWRVPPFDCDVIVNVLTTVDIDSANTTETSHIRVAVRPAQIHILLELTGQ